MAVITLTTEWKNDDYYYGIIRGTLERLAPGVQVITNASAMPTLNLSQAAFVVRNTFSHYPQGSVHLIFIHTEKSNKVRHLLVRALGHYFVGADNGMFNLMLNTDPELIVVLESKENFDDLQIFAAAAAALINGADAATLGEVTDRFREMVPLRATIDEKIITGSVIFIDSYGNTITNITRETFERVFGKRAITITIQSNRHRVSSLSTNYNDKPVGELLARFNTLDLLEIAINGANVSELYGLQTGSVIRITDDTNVSAKGSGLFT
jgi:S-adenosyl-L-methionine hydrolase (adenosine-forming)